MLFNPGSPVITLADIDREIAIAAAGAGICSAGCDTATIPDRKGESLAHRFFRKAMELRLYREAVLLAKFCGVADSGAVFKEMADWYGINCQVTRFRSCLPASLSVNKPVFSG